jgi:hypothetical protein
VLCFSFIDTDERELREREKENTGEKQQIGLGYLTLFPAGKQTSWLLSAAA